MESEPKTSKSYPKHSKILIFVLLLIIIGLLFFWYRENKSTPYLIINDTSTRPSATQNNEPESTTAEAQTESFGVISTSNEISAIEADLISTDLTSLDGDLNQIDATIEASMR